MRIDQTNYESFLLSYVDGELTDAETREVEAFCALHPEAESELGLLRQTVMVPPLMVFDQKASLYRVEKKRHVIGWYFPRAAILVGLLAGTTFLYLRLKPAPLSRTDAEKMASGQTMKVETAKSRPDSGNTSAMTSLPVIAKEKLIVAGGKDKPPAVKGNRALPVNKTTRSAASAETDIASGRKKNHPVPGGNEAAMPGLNRVPAMDDEPAPGSEAGTTKVAIETVRMSSANTPSLVAAPVNTNAEKFIAAKTGKMPAQNPVAANDGPADADPAVSYGDDAVSVLHMTKSTGVVGKLFHRLTGGKSNADQPGNDADKKVNISIFQFAVGK